MTNHSDHDTEEEQVIQTVAEPLQQMLQKKAEPSRSDLPEASAQAAKVRAFRPVSRQPTATLTVYDDGSREHGEIIRIRDSTFRIGRDKGDLKIPFDPDISSRHVTLRCQTRRGRLRWYLVDQKSTNGTFVKAYRATLSRESELILGSRRYRFQMPETPKETGESEALQTHMYQAPRGTMLEQFVPTLTEIGISQSTRSFSIGGEEHYLGSDASCDLSIEGDPFLNPRHARIYTDASNRWMIEDQKSLNGVWIRVKSFAIEKHAEFQIGEQRFRFDPNLS